MGVGRSCRPIPNVPMRNQADRMLGWLRRRPPVSTGGFSLIEVMVAAVLLLIVFFGLTQIYVRSRTQIDYEEDRRKATAIAQARLDGIRRDYRFDGLAALDGTDTTMVSDRRDYVVAHTVAVGAPESQAATVTVTVTWQAMVEGSPVDRKHEATTIFGRGMP